MASFKSLYEACCQDDRFVVRLIHIPFSHVNLDNSVDQMKPYLEAGLSIIDHNQYYLSQESPDIAFFLKPYEGIPMQYYIDEVDKVVRRCVYVPYAFFDFTSATSISYGYGLPMHYKVWHLIAYSQHHMEYITKYGFRNGDNAVILGHPRFDSSSGIHAYTEDEITVSFKKKINGRRTLCWNTHHWIAETSESAGAF